MKRASGRLTSRTKSSRRLDEPSFHEDSMDGIPATALVVPDDAIADLTEKQLEEDVSRMLHAKDPNAPTEIASYSFADNQYKKIPAGSDEHTAFHVSLDGSVSWKASEEATAQLQNEKAIREEVAARKRELERKAREEGKTLEEMEEMEDTGGKNQFNYSERAAQTYNNPYKTRGVSTRPPKTGVFAATFTQWQLYDAYMNKYRQLLHEGDEGTAQTTPHVELSSQRTGQDLVQGPECGHALCILERMVNQNAQDEIYSDFKYWEDASDLYRGNLGTLLPLWRFYDQRIKKKMVTALAWNPKYPDLFAVGYGSYDFMKQGSGVICIYTLKNVSYPEFILTTETGVMCLDFHPEAHALLCVGCYDGTVKVFDIRRGENKHLYVSDIKSGKHTDPVWQVKWQDTNASNEMHFFSVSSDGRVANWVLSKNELKMEPIMALKLAPPNPSGAGSPDASLTLEEDTSLTGLAGGCCLDFNQYEDHLFLVGTEEGRIHKCSKAYSGQYLETYEGHHMAVYAVKWNPFHPKVFLSCSADWTVKIWHHEVSTPIMTFDLNNSVGDVCWAPYSSTVFAAVTSNGKTLVFDLDVNKHEQLCEQKIVKKAKLTHVCFNTQEPILLVGDSHGAVNSLKLSPNLRKITPIPIPEQKKGEPKIEPPPRMQIEINKLERLLGAADTPSPRLSQQMIDQLSGKIAPEVTADAELDA